jgi:maleate isomerase
MDGPEGRLPFDTLARWRMGVLTPSSNTVLEPLTSAMLTEVPDSSAHFGRFRVVKITLDESGQDQFSIDEPLKAAELLADARVGVIGWSGTSASWLGFDKDEALCAEIRRRHGIEACTAVLAINEIFSRLGVTRFGLVSPYTVDVQQQIIANYRALGIDCVSEVHAVRSDNFSFAELSADEIRSMVREVAGAQPQAIVIMCTNMRGALLAAELEAELGIVLVDSVSAFVWKALQLLGAPAPPAQRWGRLFDVGAA